MDGEKCIRVMDLSLSESLFTAKQKEKEHIYFQMDPIILDGL